MKNAKIYATILIIVAFCIILTGFLSQPEDEFDQITNSIQKNISEEIYEKFGMSCNGLGGAAFNKELKYLSFGLESHKEVNIDVARKMLLGCADIYFKHINSNESLKKYMVSYPFSYENCDIVIFFNDSHHISLAHPLLCSAGIFSGKFLYNTVEDPSAVQGYKSSMIESSSEALENNEKYLKSISL